MLCRHPATAREVAAAATAVVGALGSVAAALAPWFREQAIAAPLPPVPVQGRGHPRAHSRGPVLLRPLHYEEIPSFLGGPLVEGVGNVRPELTGKMIDYDDAWCRELTIGARSTRRCA